MTKFLKNILFSSIFLTSILPIAALVSCEDKVPAKKKMTANFDAIKSNISLNSNETVGAIDLSNAVFKVNEVSIKVSNLSAEYSITKLVGSTFDFPSIIFDFIGDTPKIY
jgi:esterase/lipase superfamily enzyme